MFEVRANMPNGPSLDQAGAAPGAIQKAGRRVQLVVIKVAYEPLERNSKVQANTLSTTRPGDTLINTRDFPGRRYPTGQRE
jgi:hypothetical protein